MVLLLGREDLERLQQTINILFRTGQQCPARFYWTKILAPLLQALGSIYYRVDADRYQANFPGNIILENLSKLVKISPHQWADRGAGRENRIDRNHFAFYEVRIETHFFAVLVKQCNIWYL